MRVRRVFGPQLHSPLHSPGCFGPQLIQGLLRLPHPRRSVVVPVPVLCATQAAPLHRWVRIFYRVYRAAMVGKYRLCIAPAAPPPLTRPIAHEARLLTGRESYVHVHAPPRQSSAHCACCALAVVDRARCCRASACAACFSLSKSKSAVASAASTGASTFDARAKPSCTR